MLRGTNSPVDLHEWANRSLERPTGVRERIPILSSPLPANPMTNAQSHLHPIDQVEGIFRSPVPLPRPCRGPVYA